MLNNANKIHFTFLNDYITYDCAECKGMCCHVNNNLVITDRASLDISNYYSPLDKFIIKYRNTDLLSCGKNVGFLRATDV